jgi:hypothetical protein
VEPRQVEQAQSSRSASRSVASPFKFELLAVGKPLQMIGDDLFEQGGVSIRLGREHLFQGATGGFQNTASARERNVSAARVECEVGYLMAPMVGKLDKVFARFVSPGKRM